MVVGRVVKYALTGPVQVTEASTSTVLTEEKFPTKDAGIQCSSEMKAVGTTMGKVDDGNVKKRAPVAKDQVTVKPEAIAKTTVAKVPERERKGPAVRVEYLDETEDMDFSLTGEGDKIPISAEVFDIRLSPPESPVTHAQPRGELETAVKDTEVQQIQALGASLAAEAASWKLKSSLVPSVTQPVASAELDALVDSLALDGSFISNPMTVDLTESDGEEPMEYETQDSTAEPRGRRAKIPRRLRSWLSRAATVGKVLMKTGVDNGEFAIIVVTNVLSIGYAEERNSGGASDEMERRQEIKGTETTGNEQEKRAVAGETSVTDVLDTSALDTFLSTSALDCPESHREYDFNSCFVLLLDRFLCRAVICFRTPSERLSTSTYGRCLDGAVRRHA